MGWDGSFLNVFDFVWEILQYPPRNQQQVYPWKTSLSFFCFGLCSGAFFTFLGVYMYPYFVDERNRLCHGFRHLCVLLLHVDPPFQLLVVQKHKKKRNMWQWQRNGVCRFVHMYNVRNKQRKRGPAELPKKKIHGFKNKSNWGAYQFQFRLFVKDNFQTFFRLFHLKKRQWISMYHPSSFRNRCKLLRLSR